MNRKLPTRSSQEGRQSRSLRAARRTVLLLVATILAQSLVAAEQPRQVNDEVAASQDMSPLSDVDDVKRRRNTAAAGMILLLGIAVIGLLVIAGALIGGARIRRMARKPDGHPKHPDELSPLRNPSSDEELKAKSDSDATQTNTDDGESPTNMEETRS